MALWTNTAEGGSNHAAVTVANSGGGSGNAFDQIVTVNSGTVTYEQTQVSPSGGSAAYKGSQAIRVGAYQGHQAYVGTGALYSTAQRLRFYVRFANQFESNPTFGNSQFIQVINGSNQIAGYVYFGADCRLRFTDANENVVATTTNGLPADTWLRIETNWNPDGGSGGTVSLGYAFGDGAPVETLTRSGLYLGNSSTVKNFNIGRVSYSAVFNVAYLDQMRTDDSTSSAFIGADSVNRLRVGTSGPGLRLGTATPTAVWAGTTQIWP